MTDNYTGDLDKTRAVAELFRAAKESRGADWVKELFANVGDASFASVSPQVMRGPDGFPYFVLNIPEAGKEFQCFVIKQMLPELLQMGVGVVMEPSEKSAQWVFSYGDLLGYQISGSFEPFKSDIPVPPGFSREVVQEKEEVLIGAPSEELYPKYGRDALRKFLEAQGVKDPQILLMHRRQGETGVRELVFDIDDKKVGSHERARAILGWISWFLPRGFAYCAVNEETFSGKWLAL